MNKEWKIRIVLVLVTAIIFTSVGIYAETKINASEVTYKPISKEWEVNNIESALNELYASANQITNIEYKAFASGTVQTSGSGTIYNKDLKIAEGIKKIIVFTETTSTYSTTDPIFSGQIILKKNITKLASSGISGKYVNNYTKTEIETTGEAGNLTVTVTANGKGGHNVNMLVVYEK